MTMPHGPLPPGQPDPSLGTAGGASPDVGTPLEAPHQMPLYPAMGGGNGSFTPMPTPEPQRPSPSPVGRRLGLAAASAAIGYGAGLVFAVLTTIGIALAAIDLNSLFESSSSSGGTEAALASIALPFDLVGMALLGPVSVTVPGLASISVFAIPLAITAAIIVGIAVSQHLLARLAPLTGVTGPRWRDDLIDIAATGGTLGLFAAIVVAIARTSFAGDDITGSMGVNPFATFAGGLIVGAIGAALGQFGRRATWTVRMRTAVPPVLRRALTACAVGALPALTLGLLVALIAGLANAGFGATVAGLFSVSPNLVTAELAVASLGGIQSSGEGFNALLTLFSDMPGLAWLLVLIPVIAVVFAGVWLALTGAKERGWSDAWATPVVLMILTLLAIPVSGVFMSMQSSFLFTAGLRMSASVLLSPLTLVAAPAWGFLAEVVARTFALHLLAALPSSAVARLTALADRARQGSSARPAAGPFGGSPMPSGPHAGPQVPAASPTGPYAAPADMPVAAAGVTTTPIASPDGSAIIGPYGFAPVATGTTTVSLPTINKRKVLLIVSIIVGALILITAAFVARTVINSSMYSPQRPVEAYFSALEAGDAEAALALADPDVPNNARALLVNPVYSEVEGRPTDAVVTDVDRNGDTATVTVTYNQDGVKSTQILPVRKTGTTGLLFDDWQLIAPPVPFVPVTDVGAFASGDSQTVLVNGVELTINSSTSRGFYALPGMYTVTLPDEGAYLTSSALNVVVSTPADISSDGSLTYSWTKAAEEAAVNAAKAHLAQCLASTELEPDGCGFAARWSWYPPETVAWTLTTEPTFSVDADGPRLTVQLTKGKATATGTAPAMEGARPEAEPWEQEVSLSYSESYEIVDGQLQLIDD